MGDDAVLLQCLNQHFFTPAKNLPGRRSQSRRTLLQDMMQAHFG